MFCTKCGQENEDGSKFCRFCGESFTAAGAPGVSDGGSNAGAGASNMYMGASNAGVGASAGKSVFAEDDSADEQVSQMSSSMNRTSYAKSDRDPIREMKYKKGMMISVLVMVLSLAAIIVIFVLHNNQKNRPVDPNQTANTAVAVQESQTQAGPDAGAQTANTDASAAGSTEAATKDAGAEGK